MDPPRRGTGVGPSARARQGTAKYFAQRRAVRHQGYFRYRRYADDLWLADLCRLPARERRQRRGIAARCRRDTPRQDRHDRIRQSSSRPDKQPARSRFYPGRFVERLGGGGCRLHGAARHRHADRRLGDPAGRLLRGRRVQAEFRAVPAGRHADQHRGPRHGRYHGALGRRHRAVPRGDDGDPLYGAGDPRDRATARPVPRPALE